MKSINRTYRRIWRISLVSFILAAVTGFLYRLNMIYPLFPLDLINIRHAHSHLMFFNWVSPPIMIWMASSLEDQATKLINPNRYKICLYTMLLLGLLAYPFFLLHGYRSISIGSADLPMAAILSGWVMITWYWFGWLYFNDRKQTESTLSLFIFDGALVALLISSLGAWGVSVFQFGDLHNPLYSSALTYFFLAVFTEGWAVLGVLGMIWNQLSDRNPFNSGWLWKPVLFGSMLIFPFSLSQSLITPLMLYSAKAGLLLIVISLSLHFYLFLSSKDLTGFVWKSILLLIGAKILLQVIAILPFDLWPGEHGIRILYLHLILLGIVSITIFQSYHSDRENIPLQAFTVTVLLVLLSLFLVSRYAPLWLIPSQTYHWIMYIAFLPIIPAVWILTKEFKTESFYSSHGI